MSRWTVLTNRRLKTKLRLWWISSSFGWFLPTVPYLACPREKKRVLLKEDGQKMQQWHMSRQGASVSFLAGFNGRHFNVVTSYAFRRPEDEKHLKWPRGNSASVYPLWKIFYSTLTRKRQFVDFFSTHHGTHLSSFTLFWLVSSHFLAIFDIFLEKTKINELVFHHSYLIIFISRFLHLGQ